MRRYFAAQVSTHVPCWRTAKRSNGSTIPYCGFNTKRLYFRLNYRILIEIEAQWRLPSIAR